MSSPYFYRVESVSPSDKPHIISRKHKVLSFFKNTTRALKKHEVYWSNTWQDMELLLGYPIFSQWFWWLPWWLPWYSPPRCPLWPEHDLCQAEAMLVAAVLGSPVTKPAVSRAHQIYSIQTWLLKEITHIYVYIYIHMYIYIYMYVYIYTHIYIYM